MSLLALTFALITSTAHAAPSAADVAQGGNLFSITCSSSFCHGEAGVGAKGPSLRNRNFPPDFVRNTVMNGRSGTAMPSFKDSVNQAELEMIVAYVMSLSPNNHSADAGPAATPAPFQPAAPLSATAQAGQAIFFDLSRPGACAACHSYRVQGGPIGPDLSGIAKRTPRDIYNAMVSHSRLTDPENYRSVRVQTDEYTSVSGIVKQDTEEVVRIYDLSSTPPVLRSFWAPLLVSLNPPLDYKHDLTGLSKDDLAALITYLKSADAASKDVTPQDLTQP